MDQLKPLDQFIETEPQSFNKPARIDELTDLQLALVGGGIGDFIPG